MLLSNLTHPEKILFSGAGISKLDLANYYLSVADYLLPHIQNRPLTLVRCPNSGQNKCFYQKHWMEGSPEGIEIVSVPGKTQISDYVMINHASGLIAAAQLAALEIHPWASRSDRLEQPDRLIFDLDPSPEISWNTLVEASFIVRDSLTALDLVSYVKLTGGKGIHIVVPISRRKAFPEIKHFCRLLSEKLANHFPNLLTAEISKKKRVDKIFIDYLRNDHEATAIAAFSPRANPDANVAVPISWEALNKVKSSKKYSIKTIDQYFKDYPEDPWQDFFIQKQSLTKQHFDALTNLS